jgi:16S rRNA (adenine1518-N6/adenine1519-N6)-dimethyltransferase
MQSPIRAKKSYGQHFLADAALALRIVQCLRAESGCALEVGAGTGALTQHLLARADIQLFAVESDADAAAYLVRRFPAIEPKLFCMDVLKMNMQALMPARYSVIGNFPYNISSQILFKILQCRSSVDEVVCMLQKEVGRRLAAPAGSREGGILSVLAQAYYSVEYLFDVPASVFIPQPKVESCVVRLWRNDMLQLPCNEDMFVRIVRAAFNQRRKTMRNALWSMLGERTAALPYMNLRAEALSVSDYVALTNAVCNG